MSGDGVIVQNWLYVEDSVDALVLVATLRRLYELYNLVLAGDRGSPNERTNSDLMVTIFALVNHSHAKGPLHNRLITRMSDMPAHNTHYAIDAAKTKKDLGWISHYHFQKELEWTLSRYLAHLEGCEEVRQQTCYVSARISSIEQP